MTTSPMLRRAGHGAVLLPLNVVSLVTGRPGPRGRALAAVGVVLGALAVIPLGVEVLFVARGVLYGFVVPGPYDTSWGGPTRAGAWAAHFLVGAPFAALAIVALAAIAGLHGRWARLLRGERGSGWVVWVSAVVVLAAAVLVWSWSRQI